MKSSCSQVLPSILTFITMYLGRDSDVIVWFSSPVYIEHPLAHLNLLLQQYWILWRDLQQENVGSICDKELEHVLEARSNIHLVPMQGIDIRVSPAPGAKTAAATAGESSINLVPFLIVAALYL